MSSEISQSLYSPFSSQSLGRSDQVRIEDCEQSFFSSFSQSSRSSQEKIDPSVEELIAEIMCSLFTDDCTAEETFSRKIIQKEQLREFKEFVVAQEALVRQQIVWESMQGLKRFVTSSIPFGYQEKEQCSSIRTSDFIRNKYKVIFKDFIETNLFAKDRSLSIHECIQRVVNQSLSLQANPFFTLVKYGIQEAYLQNFGERLHLIFDCKRDLMVRRWMIKSLSELITNQAKRVLPQKSIQPVNEDSFDGEITKRVSEVFASELKKSLLVYVSNMKMRLMESFVESRKACENLQWNPSHPLTSDLAERENIQGIGINESQRIWINEAMKKLRKEFKERLSTEIALPFLVFPKPEPLKVLQNRTEEELEPSYEEIRVFLEDQVKKLRQSFLFIQGL